MNELHHLLKPSWDAEKWIAEGWDKINAAEKALIKSRMDQLFCNGLPFKLKYDKLVYIHTFALLAQLEVLAIQIPLRFEDSMSTPQLKQQMRAQLLDEIFHGMVFTKIVYLLCEPHALPPTYNEHIEQLCNFIRQEECPRVGLVLLNLVAEGWIEQVFLGLYQQNVAPEVFNVILEDEHRHVREADLYCSTKLPNKRILRQKLKTLEEILLANITLQPKYFIAISKLLGISGTHALIQTLHETHTRQLKKINLIPGEQWRFLVPIAIKAFSSLQPLAKENIEIDMSPMKKVFMSQWGNPADPTMVGQFDIDVSGLNFYENRDSLQPLLTMLMMQAISYFLMQDDRCRHYLSYKKLYLSQHAYVAIIVRLPGCGDQIGNIILKDCHKMTIHDLSIKIRKIQKLMVYCYKQREYLDKKHPLLKQRMDELLMDFTDDHYPCPLPGSAVVSLSNVAFGGYTHVISPLRKNEALKFSLLSVERKPVWDPDTQSFKAKDVLPVSISADHRVFDGSWPMAELIGKAFQIVVQNMSQTSIDSLNFETRNINTTYLNMAIDKLMSNNVELGYQTLSLLQTVWPDFMTIEDIIQFAAKKAISTRLETWVE